MIGEFKGAHRFLSSFWPATVDLDGMTYPTVEHAYQAAKNPSAAYRHAVRICRTPGDAKRAGRQAVLRPDWEAEKVNVMYTLLKQKFRHYPMKDMLLSTGDEELAEGNHWGDTFWGVCKGVGANHLGKLLMKVREELRG